MLHIPMLLTPLVLLPVQAPNGNSHSNGNGSENGEHDCENDIADAVVRSVGIIDVAHPREEGVEMGG